MNDREPEQYIRPLILMVVIMIGIVIVILVIVRDVILLGIVISIFMGLFFFIIYIEVKRANREEVYEDEIYDGNRWRMDCPIPPHIGG